METEKHRVTSFDGTSIYYESYGKGPVICASNGIGVTTCFWNYLVDYFSPKYRVILWDYRFHGHSGPGPDYHSLTMETNAKDLKAVLDHAGVSEAMLLGHSMGVQTIFEFYRQNPEKVAALVPVLGSYGQPMNTFLGTDLISYLFPLGFHTVFLFPNLVKFFSKLLYKIIFIRPIAFTGGSLTGFINGHHFDIKDLGPYLEHLEDLDLRAFLGMAKRMQENSAEDILGKIDVPTLIIAGEKDLFTPWKISEEMRQLIPDSEMLTIPKGSHAALVEQPELMNLRIEKFIRDRLMNSEWFNGQ